MKVIIDNLMILMRILCGIILILGFIIGYSIGLFITFITIFKISIVICTTTIVMYDIISGLIIIMILGIYNNYENREI
jgi:hypothetical protein